MSHVKIRSRNELEFSADTRELVAFNAYSKYQARVLDQVIRQPNFIPRHVYQQIRSCYLHREVVFKITTLLHSSSQQPTESLIGNIVVYSEQATAAPGARTGDKRSAVCQMTIQEICRISFRMQMIQNQGNPRKDYSRTKVMDRPVCFCRVSLYCYVLSCDKRAPRTLSLLYFSASCPLGHHR